MKNTAIRAYLPGLLLAASTTSLLGYSPAPVESQVGFNQNPDDKSYVEFVRYKQIVHSSSQGFEVGENAEIQAAFKYHPSKDGFFRLRFNTDPKKNATENKTSKLELIMNHKIGEFEIQLDSDIKTDDGERGGTSFGPDTDSDYSFISYKPNNQWAMTFYPFNFNGEVGNEFYTGDVTRIYYIEGTPEAIPSEPSDNERIRTKTLPGFDVKYKPMDSLTISVGAGAARYLYPNGADFNIETELASESWQAKSDTGYKLGVDYYGENTKVIFKYVTHEEAEETGALLQSALNLRFEQKFGAFGLGLELASSKAGKNAYNIAYDSSWFSENNPWRPVYKDENDVRHSWLGKEDQAYFVRGEYEVAQGWVPFVSYKNIGKNFVFWEIDSVHRLRTADGSDSHGGLEIYGAGLKIIREGYVLKPEYELLNAQNEVFENKTDIRENDSFVERNTKQSRFTISITYSL